MQPQIFISYRRDDAAGYARAVNDELVRAFGAERVFIDVDDINAGQPFSDIIQRSVGDSAVLLALIGKRWRGERDDATARIFDAGDFVRQEVAVGLARGLRVIPVLLDGATMPAAAQLPFDLSALAGRNALELDNTRFAADMAHLVRQVRGALGEPEPAAAAPQPASRTWRWLAAPVVALAALVALWQWQRAPAPAAPPARVEPASTLPTAPTAATAAVAPVAPAARAAIDGEWRAAVTYDWDNARHEERFAFGGEGSTLHGSASFLGVARGVLEGRVDGDGLAFVTRTSESSGGGELAVVHRYRARLAGDELRFVMQTEGGSSPHVPVEFVARRVAPAASAASR